MKSGNQQFVAQTLLLGVIVFVSASMFAVPMRAMDHEGMTGTAHSILCPLMGGVSAECIHTDLPEEYLLPTVLVLVLLTGMLIVFALRSASESLQRLRYYSLPPPYYQELFSSGILNSKRY